jgi:UDP-N-acetylglucosamine diphosphorylase / glucose-1-phosphate thymidylyltransferase / UDP-N-acetylgalactosamine diphosphorylase / glucosamine-1-phosphate N-acetyltransferase / galactosamine-1-phosphate N-acetyltransferase
MKAVVLAGGRGSRLNEATAERNKCMLQHDGRYIIEYSLENALRARVDSIVLVVGYRAETIINEFGNSYHGVPIQYVIQWERKGLVHALESARETVAGSDFFLFLSDEIVVGSRHAEMRAKFEQSGAFGLCGVVQVEDRTRISRTYAVFLDGNDSRIHRLIEKPRNPMNNIQGTGNCIFKNTILDYIQFTPIHQVRQEKELPDLIQCAVDDGKVVCAFEIASGYANINTIEELQWQSRAVAVGVSSGGAYAPDSASAEL